MTNQLTDLEKALHDARTQFSKTAEQTYKRLNRELQTLIRRGNRAADRVKKLRQRLQGELRHDGLQRFPRLRRPVQVEVREPDERGNGHVVEIALAGRGGEPNQGQVERAARTGTKAAQEQALKLEKMLADARDELRITEEDKRRVRQMYNEARKYVKKSEFLDKAVSQVETQLEKAFAKKKPRKRPARKKAAAKKKPAARKKAAAKRPASKKKAATKKKPAAKKKAAASKRPAKKKSAAKKRPAARKKAATKKKAAPRRKATVKKKPVRRKAASKKKVSKKKA